MTRFVCALAALAVLTAPQARADGKGKVIQELAETLAARFGGKVKNVPALAARIESAVARHGDEVIHAVKRVGPGALGLVENAGVNGTKAAAILTKYGEAGAARVVARPQAMALVTRFGDDTVHALVHHPGVAERLIERGGLPAVKALRAVTPQNGRRLAMLLEGELAKSPKHADLLAVISRYGDRGCRFIWDNKGALAMGAVLTAFIMDPEPFLDGVKDLAEIAAVHTAQPIAEGIGRSVNGTAVAITALILAALFLAVFCWGLRARIAGWLALRRKQPAQSPIQTP